LAERKLIERFAMNWRICWLNFDFASDESFRTVLNGKRLVAILALPMSAPVTNYRWLRALLNVVSYIGAKIAVVILPEYAGFGEPPPVWHVVGHLLTEITMNGFDFSLSKTGLRVISDSLWQNPPSET
jgi:hypothetical protein